MSGVLTIAAARTQARYLGHPADAAAVKTRLNALLTGPVAGRLADVATGLGPDQVICLPEIAVRLRLTRAELDSPAAADRWVAAIEAALARTDRAGPVVWRFAHRRAFHAGYIRHRLGLLPAPPGVFAGFGALDLLSPLRAMAEMLAADPSLWAGLADAGTEAALTLLRAVVVQAGEAGVAMVLAQAASGQGDAAGEMAQGLRRALGQLPGSLALMPVVATDLWPSLSAPAQRLLAALLISPLVPGDPLPLAGLFVTVLALARQSGRVTPKAMSVGLARLQVDSGSVLPEAGVLAGMARQDTDFAAELSAVLPALLQYLPARAQHGKVVTEDSRAEITARKTPKTPAPAPDIRHFSAPFAGVALVLPHLAEDGIGAAFPAAERLTALAMLIRSDLFALPEASDFLRALTGMDEKVALPDRPNPRDLLFIPQANHAAILAADLGAPRLAAWAMARFAATLPGLGASSLPFLQRQFFHSPGEVWIDREQITVRLDPMPLLAVLELAGRCGADLARLDWLDRQHLTIRCERVM